MVWFVEGRFGEEVGRIGDIDGDGLADVLIGALCGMSLQKVARALELPGIEHRGALNAYM